MILAWPLLLLGRPAYISDSAAYYKGGHVAVSFALEHLRPPADNNPQFAPRGPIAPSGAAATAAQARGARSILYSVLAYVLGAPAGQMLILAIFQALLTGLVCAVVIDFFAPSSPKKWLTAAAVLAFATPVAFVACLALPDIFTGLVIIAIVLPAIGEARMSTATKLLLMAVGAFGVAAHSSHPPLAAVLTLVIALRLLFAWYRGHCPANWGRAWAWAAAPLVLGVALTVCVNRVGFGAASIAAKRFPLTLARSVADGPGRWYLEKHCSTEHYAVCELFPSGFPHDINDFLWGKTGLDDRATPEQLDRIRREEVSIVAAATREYLGVELLHLFTGFLRQLVKISPDASFDQRISLDRQQIPHVVPSTGMTAWLGQAVYLASLISVAAALLWMARRFRYLQESEKLAIFFTLTALLTNAAICVFFSGIAHRYQARVAWLIPLLAIALASVRSRQIASSGAQPELGRH